MAQTMESDLVNGQPRQASEGRKPYKVLFVIPGDGTGTPMVFVRRQVRSLQQAGVDSHIFYLTSRTAPWVIWTCGKMLRQEIHRLQPDIVHAQYGTMTALVCALVVKKPLVITYRGSDLNPSIGLSWIRSATGKVCSQIAALAARHIICVSSQLRERLWWRKKRVTVIPNGVDTTIFHPRRQQDVRQELGWDLDERIVLFNAGNGATGKRQDLVEGGVEVARRICGNIRLVVLSGNIDPGEIPDFMNGADCLIMASDWEGSPNIVKEALACNLPVVSVDVGDAREHLEQVTPSIIVSRAPEAIGRATAEILTDRKRSNGFEYIEQKLSLPVVAQRILTVYGSK